jgi:hypothetical protein
MAVALGHAPPMMRGATRFPHDVARRLVCQEARELAPIEAAALDKPPLPIRNPHFEHRH